MDVSFIIPCRNNIVYFLQAYNSVRKYYPTTEIIALDDASVDGTYEELVKLHDIDNNLIIVKNDGPERMGHTILYDLGIQHAKNEIVTILHSDMVIGPGYLEDMLKHIAPKTVVSATRIEPPLHPPGLEKHVIDFGWEPKTFNELNFIDKVNQLKVEHANKTTEGIFAPWMIYKTDFEKIGGHDKLFAPMELEDSDIFNRMLLAGYEFVQARDALVYHMTCRGSRFKDGLEIEAEIPMPDGSIWHKAKDSEEYKTLRNIKFREWWRKWGTNVLHDTLMKPIVGSRYNIGYVVMNCSLDLLQFLEPWSTNVYIDDEILINKYIASEQTTTRYNLVDRVMTSKIQTNDIIVTFDANLITEQTTSFIMNTSKIFDQLTETGDYEFDIFKIKVNVLEPLKLPLKYVVVKNIY